MNRYDNMDVDKLKKQGKALKLMRILEKGEDLSPFYVIDAIIELQDERCVEPAIQMLLYNDDELKKINACEVLGGLKAQSAVESLIWVLENTAGWHETLYSSIVDTLKDIGDSRAIPAIAKTKLVYSQIKFQALDVLGWEPSVYLPFYSTQEKVEYYIYKDQYDSICDIGADAAPILMTELSTGRYEKAAEALVKINSKQVCAAIIENWLKPDCSIYDEKQRIAVVNVLGELRCPGAIIPLVNILKYPYDYLYQSMIDCDLLDAAQKALANFGKEAYQYVKELADPQIMNPIWYELRKYYLAAEQEVKRYAVKAISATGHPDVFDLFLKLMKSRDYEYKEVAAYGFEALGDKRAIEVLEKAKRVKNGRAGFAAERALEVLQNA